MLKMPILFTRPLVPSLLFALSLLFSGPEADARKLKILTSTTDLASITEAIAGPHAEVESLCRGKEDPHFLPAKPSYVMMARDVDLFITVGMDLEVGWERLIIDGSRNTAIRRGSIGYLDASERVAKLDVPNTRVTRAMGDVHPSGNPHYWLDPLNGRIVAATITDRLAELAPAGAVDFRRNLKEFRKSLDERMFGKTLVDRVGGAQLWSLQLKGQLDSVLRERSLDDQLGGWLARMRPHSGQGIIIYHRSWIYFTNRFGLAVTAELEPKPGIPPSPAHLAGVIEKAKAHGVKAILLEPYYPRKAADQVAAKTGAKVVVCANSVGGQPEATDYLALIDLIVNELSGALK